MDLCGELFQSQVLHVVTVDVVEQNTEPLDIARRGGIL